MKNTKRILCAMLAMVLLLSVMLTGCKRPQVTFNKIPSTAATYGDGKELTTGQYLAYLYLEFENMYFNQGLYQYASYGLNPWEQTFPYGESDEKIPLSDYIIRSAQDNIKRQIVLTQMMKDNGLKWIAEDEGEVNKSLASLEKDAFIELGFNNDSYAYALKNANLNERSTFYGLYGAGGKRAIAEDELKEYFEENYLSYKAISIALTDSNGKELDKEGEAYKKIMDYMNKYMEVYEKEGFDAAYEVYEKDQEAITDLKETEATTTTTTTGTGTNASATGTGTSAATTTTTAAPTTTTTTATGSTSGTGSDASTTTGTTAVEEEEEHDHEHNHRQDVDSASKDFDEALKYAIIGKTDDDGNVEQEGIEEGECKIVEYKAGGSTPTVALIERLDPDKDDEGNESTAVYEDAKESIIYTKKYEEFDEEVSEAVAALKITFNEKVVNYADCKPEKFLEIMENL